ncbi:hypothetical protein THAPSDRAFT_262697, partial [Thalassiosira pseudonana CCMP1335]
SQNDIVRRLQTITETLSTDTSIEPNSPQHPSLASLASTLISPSYLHSKDKDIRLHSVLACMELFYIYAPEPPWDEEEILGIFEQMIRQLGNLAHCTADSGNFEYYFRILEQLSEVKIGVVLVDLIRTESSVKKEALEMLCELIKTILQCVSVDHPPEVVAHAEIAISACIEEFEGVIPICVLDELLVTMPPSQIQQTNTSYLVAAKVVRKTEDKISSPIAGLLNGLLGGDPYVVDQTSISCVDGNVWSISYELHRIAPNILTTVIGTVATSLVSGEANVRWRATKLLGRLFGARTSDIAKRFGPCFRDWLRRGNDNEPKIRETMVKCLVNFITNKHNEIDLCSDVSDTLANIITNDPILEIPEANASNDRRTPNPPISAISSELLHAVGKRVMSKNKTEHRDAITGLAQIYYKH